MSANKKQSNITMKLKDVDPSQIIVDKINMKGEIVPLIKYGPEKKVLVVQLSKIRMSQGGLKPGETLANGKKNEYYLGEDARKNLRIPMDVHCAVPVSSDDTETTNADDISEEINVLKKIDERIKTALFGDFGIDADDKEKYDPIFKKPKKAKKTDKKQVDEKEKFTYINTKFDVTNDTNKSIRTEFFEVDGETGQAMRLNDDSTGFISLEEVEKLVTFNSEVIPIIKFVKVWTQPTGAWGVTLKLMKLRVKKQASKKARDDADFLDSDGESETIIKESKTSTKKVVSSDDEESDEKPVVAVKQATTAKKIVASVPSDDESSDEESDEKPVVAAKPVNTTTAKKIVAVETSDDEESDDEPVKPPAKSAAKGKTTTTATKSKKSSA
jgi:hypothetical protein